MLYVHCQALYARDADNVSLQGVMSRGCFGTPGYQLFLTLTKPKSKSVDIASFWHDIPCYTQGMFGDMDADGCVSFVNEIPLASRYKMEVSKKIKNNPITHDKPSAAGMAQFRFSNDVRYTKHGVPFFGYGCIPQTWCPPVLDINRQV